MNTPISKISKAGVNAIFYGESGSFNVKLKSVGVSKTYKLHFDGIVNFIKEQAKISYVKTIEDGPLIICRSIIALNVKVVD